MVSTVNHVINYVPELDLFLDSTSSTTPFGMLPFQVADKPVLLMDGFKDGLRTPATAVGSNEQHTKTAIKVQSDGSIKATMDIAQKGMFAANSRAWMRNFPKEQEAELVKNAFESSGMIATGSLKKDDPTALLDRYKFGLKMEVKSYFQRPGAGAFMIEPLFWTEAPVQRYVWSAVAPDETHDVACSNGTSIEEYTYTFPEDMQVLSVPDNFEMKNQFLSYQATYTLAGRKLTVFRKFEDRTAGNVCSPALMAEYKALTAQVIPNMRAQVLYK